tara:strand:+ start:2985 stop:3524 length:540 start_codon:yes stop_codon:yes gene_type:complete
VRVKKFRKNKGVLIFITGLSGSGKSVLAKKIHPSFNRIFGPTILINGDDLRKIFKLYGFSSEDRLENSKKFAKFFKIITKQNISILFAGIGMRHKTRFIFKKAVQNYFEIYIQASLGIIKKKSKKKIYKKFKSNIVGVDITPELPKNPDIKIKNDFKLSINELSQLLKKKIDDFKFDFN